MSEWISVEESLPPHDKRVLVWEMYSEFPFGGYLSSVSVCWKADCEHHDAEGGWSGAIVISDVSQNLVTHWMPLPEPPK